MFKNLFRAQGNTRQLTEKTAPVCVSLTTTRSRLATVHQTIRSILEQTMPADKVILWLSEEPYLQDEGIKPGDIPNELADLTEQGLTIAWTPNIGPFRKLIPTLAQEKNDELLIITADDDVIYPDTWISKLYSESVAYPGCVICYRARKIKRTLTGKIMPYVTWDLTFPAETVDLLGPNRDIFPTGKDGVLYPRKVFTDEVFNEAVFMEIAPTSDDTWFKAMTLLTGTKVRNIAQHDDFPDIPAAQAQRLFDINHDRNDAIIQKVFKRYRLK